MKFLREIGDFAILIESGYGRTEALRYNLMFSLSTLVGGVLVYFSLAHLHEMLPYILALAASSFVYVAIAGLIPSLHQRTTIAKKSAFQQIGLIAFSVFLVYWSHGQIETFHDRQGTGETKTTQPLESGPVLDAKIANVLMRGAVHTSTDQVLSVGFIIRHNLESKFLKVELPHRLLKLKQSVERDRRTKENRFQTSHLYFVDFPS